MKMKKTVTLLLVFCLTICMFSCGVLAEESGTYPTSGTCGAESDQVQWKLTGDPGNRTLTVSGTGMIMDCYAERDFGGNILYSPYIYMEPERAEFPDEVLDEVTKIVIEEGITVIGTAAFEFFPNCTSVEIPKSVTSIRDWAFRGLGKVKDLSIPESVTFIGAGAFKDWSSLEELIIPDSVTEIGHANTDGYDSRIGAFQGCTALKTVSLSKNLKTIYNWTFSGCTSLKTVEIPEGITVMGTEVENTGSSEIGNPYMGGIGIFEGCTSLESITIPSSVKTIYEYAFFGCTALKDIYYEGSESDWQKVEMRNVGNYETAMQARMHYLCKTGKIYTAGDYHGEGELIIPEGITAIDEYAFENCSTLKTVKFPSTLTRIGYYAFHNCTSLESVTIPGSVKYILRGSFAGCTGLKELVLSGGTMRIGTDMAGEFSGQVKPKGYGSFEGCTGLKTVYIPRTVIEIGEYSFYDCPALSDVYYEGTEAEWKQIPIVNGSNQPVITQAQKHYGSGSSGTEVPEREANCPSARYTDVDPTKWYHEFVDYAVSKGIMAGTSYTTFGPDDNVTRATLVQVLYALENKPEMQATGVFSDVAQGKWYSDAVFWAAKNKIVSGYEDGTFKPNRSISRQEMAVMIYAYAGYKGMDVSAKGDLSRYRDRSSISGYAVTALSWAVGEQYMNGVGGSRLDPTGTTTRAQLATVMKSVLEKQT